MALDKATCRGYCTVAREKPKWQHADISDRGLAPGISDKSQTEIHSKHDRLALSVLSEEKAVS